MKRLSLTLLLLLATSCATPTPRQPAPVVWEDDDRHPIAEPKEYWSGLMWDGADKMAFRPVTRALILDDFGPAKNVNVYGEVPNSSWYQNRISLRPMDGETVARGPCEKDIDTDAVWHVKSGKVDGANPGFVIEDTSDGRRYLLKFDSFQQLPERATAADVIGSKIYWAAGFSTPCNRVVHFKRENLQIGEGASKKDEIGRKTSMSNDDIVSALRNAPVTKDGRIRASASLFLPGKPLGPFTYEGTRRDDPNDVIPHEDRRELRGSRVLAAWTNHFDAREQNTFTTFISNDKGKGYVQHHIIDFGDIFGSNWESDAMTRRFGFASYWDAPQILADFVTFGVIRRPWDDLQRYPEGEIFGYFDVQSFEPHQWKDGYPNASFTRMDSVDAYWGARIVARFTRPVLEEVVKEAKFTDPGHGRYLVNVLMGRRAKIIERYLYPLSALDTPRLTSDQICLRDLLVEVGYTTPEASHYQRLLPGGEWEHVDASPEGEVCAPLSEDSQTFQFRVRRPSQREAARPVKITAKGGSEPRLLVIDRR